MIHCSSSHDYQHVRSELVGSIGFVATMGSLHDGHFSLIKRSLEMCDHTVVSIFVNPTQFAAHEDFDQYPRLLEKDLGLCKFLGVDVLFTPADADIYPNGIVEANYMPNKRHAELLCGKKRPHFFYGVCNVVERLFRIIQPTHAFFGNKDLQQRVLIERMVSDLELPISIVACPIVRGKNGLALSSRNLYLSQEDYKKALLISKTLRDVQQIVQYNYDADGESESWSTYKIRQYVAARIESGGLKGEYVEIFRPDTVDVVSGVVEDGDYCCVAAICNGVRLIDNIKL